MGTEIIPPKPKYSIIELYLLVGLIVSSSGVGMVPLKAGKKEAIKNGTIIHNKAGINKYTNKCPVVTFLPIQSMVVVTSPIGDQAPPAFAAIIIKPAYQIRIFLSNTIFCKMEISTIVAVRLSIIAERKNAKNPKIHKIRFLLLVFT